MATSQGNKNLQTITQDIIMKSTTLTMNNLFFLYVSINRTFTYMTIQFEFLGFHMFYYNYHLSQYDN